MYSAKCSHKAMRTSLMICDPCDEICKSHIWEVSTKSESFLSEELRHYYTVHLSVRKSFSVLHKRQKQWRENGMIPTQMLRYLC